ncbi:sensory rhodopsin transducer [Anaeromyxobacter oryzae]|uniref:Sensory rhodopsin transducer n=1 Tax=Anaeromyxobacter oryzae TaxID=2918170 RepID=A0ABN6MU79_9BACT|nr:sensory rhodopsin transducer [Anaeromyxobacter oryzae]BDG04481.1 hypothetical protein AMOR_34770 [Anaeromyxobacter oryzae]
MTIGHRTWAIPEGWLPPRAGKRGRALESHEAACVLNAGDADAHLEFEIFFRDRDPAGPYHVTVPARRTLHLRFDDLEDPEPVPRGVEFASVIRSDVPVVIQHTRLDARDAEISLMTTLAFSAAGEGA